MFGSEPPKDEFRLLLKSHIGYSEETLDASHETNLSAVAAHLHMQTDRVLSWAQGRSRPTPPEEYRIIAFLKALKNFA